MHKNSLMLFERYGLPMIEKEGSRILEVGPDAEFTVWKMVCEKVGDVIYNTADIAARPGVYLMPNEYTFPKHWEGSFDFVLNLNVIEHVRRPWLWVEHLKRLLKHGGHLITVTPTSWPYHAAPIDCWRIFPDGMAALHDNAEMDTILAKNECLETRSFDAEQILPGRGADWQTIGAHYVEQRTGTVMIERAFDTIGIAQRIG